MSQPPPLACPTSPSHQREDLKPKIVWVSLSPSSIAWPGATRHFLLPKTPLALISGCSIHWAIILTPFHLSFVTATTTKSFSFWISSSKLPTAEIQHPSCPEGYLQRNRTRRSGWRREKFKQGRAGTASLLPAFRNAAIKQPRQLSGSLANGRKVAQISPGGKLGAPASIPQSQPPNQGFTSH